MRFITLTPWPMVLMLVFGLPTARNWRKSILSPLRNSNAVCAEVKTILGE
jgi:hypothetical protein